MTIHAEDTMTRERALEEAARLAETLPTLKASMPGVRGEYHATVHGEQIAKAIRALASAQQEPAPAADAEEVARQVYDDMQEDNSHEQNVAIIAAALRRYTGDSGVTDAMSEALDFADRLIERGYGTDTPKEWHQAYKRVAAARAKSGEKGGANV